MEGEEVAAGGALHRPVGVGLEQEMDGLDGSLRAGVARDEG